MSFLAPLHLSRSHFSAVHILKNAWLTPSLKTSSPLWLAPQSASPFGGENSLRRITPPHCLLHPFGSEEADERLNPPEVSRCKISLGWAQGTAGRRSRRARERRGRGEGISSCSRRERKVCNFLILWEGFYSILHEKLNFVMGRTRLPKLLPQCLVLKYKIHQG